MLPVAIMLSLGDQLTARTQLVWPLSVWRGVPVSQSHTRAVESPLPDTIREDDDAAKDVANIASPCPDIEAEHLDATLTRNTACGVYCKWMMSSAVFIPG